jgi:hypothetical protein
VEGEHIGMPAFEQLVAHLHDQASFFLVQLPAIVIGKRRCALQDRIGRDHLAGDEIMTDAEVFEGALRLRAPQLVCRYLDNAEAVCLLAHIGHVSSPETTERIALCGPDHLGDARISPVFAAAKAIAGLSRRDYQPF